MAELDVERLARAMESVWPGWLDEAPGTREAQREMRDHARSLIEEYDLESGEPASEPPPDAVEVLREAIHAHLCQHNDNEWSDVDVAKAILTPWVRNALATALAASLPALAPHPDPASAMQQATFNGGLPAPAHRGRVMAMNEEREVIDGIDVTGWARCGSPGCGVIEQVPSEHPHALPADPSGADR
jgi:hypothetical protein